LKLGSEIRGTSVFDIHLNFEAWDGSVESMVVSLAVASSFTGLS
jgi:hypothetical protein